MSLVILALFEVSAVQKSVFVRNHQWYMTSIKQMVQKYTSCTTDGHVQKTLFCTAETSSNSAKITRAMFSHP